MFNGALLQNDYKSMRECNIKNKSEIHLVPKLKGGMKIYIASYKGLLELNVEKGFLIKKVKRQIEDLIGIPASCHELYYREKQMINDKTLRYHKVKKESIISLVLLETPKKRSSSKMLGQTER